MFNDKEYEFNRGRFEFRVPSLRVSLISKCNERCFYCHNEGISKKMPSVIQTGDIINTIYLLKEFGLKKVKITGGEPLLYEDLKNLLYKIKHIADVELLITTNGTLIKKRIKDLSPNIISKVSVSLDTLDPAVYKYITGKNLLGEVIAGLNMLKRNGYIVEINNLLLKSLNTSKKCLQNMINYCVENGFDLQFIEMSNKTVKPFYSKYYSEPYKTLQKGGLEFKAGASNDRQFFKIKGSKITLCKNVNDVGESSGERCGGLRLLPNGVLKNFLYE
ncbi:MAG: radical SAM protein [bacterium]|jgi:cyclic pyranopterin phosphate synthase